MSRTHGLAALGIVTGTLFTIGFALAVPSSPRQEPSGASKNAQVDSYERGVELAEAEEWAEARKIFEQLDVEKPRDPDVLNMLAYTQRKTGDLDTAIENYRRALEIRPKFPQAREYLAEAFLQAALREAEMLRSYEADGKEELGELVEAFEAASAHAASVREGQEPQGSKHEDAKKSSKW